MNKIGTTIVILVIIAILIFFLDHHRAKKIPNVLENKAESIIFYNNLDESRIFIYGNKGYKPVLLYLDPQRLSTINIKPPGNYPLRSEIIEIPNKLFLLSGGESWDKFQGYRTSNNIFIFDLRTPDMLYEVGHLLTPRSQHFSFMKDADEVIFMGGVSKSIDKPSKNNNPSVHGLTYIKTIESFNIVSKTNTVLAEMPHSYADFTRLGDGRILMTHYNVNENNTAKKSYGPMIYDPYNNTFTIVEPPIKLDARKMIPLGANKVILPCQKDGPVVNIDTNEVSYIGTTLEHCRFQFKRVNEEKIIITLFSSQPDLFPDFGNCPLYEPTDTVYLFNERNLSLREIGSVHTNCAYGGEPNLIVLKDKVMLLRPESEANYVFELHN